MSSPSRLVSLLGLLLAVACGGGDSSVSWNTNLGGDPPADGDTGADAPGSGTAGSGSVPDDTFDGPFALSIPVWAQEVLTAGETGRNRLAATATFGLPLSQADAVPVDPGSGRPALAVQGSSRWQFEVLDTWPEGTARWVLVDLLTDVAAAQPTGLVVTEGPGVSAGAPLVDAGTAGLLSVDTGPLQATISTSAFDLFESVTVDGQGLVVPSAARGIAGTTASGGALRASLDTQVSVARNGPALAEIRADGRLVDDSDATQAFFTCRMVFRVASRDVEVTMTLRNASTTRKEHVQLGSLELVVDTLAGAEPVVSVPAHPGAEAFTGVLDGSDECVLYVGQTSAKVSDIAPNSPPSVYKPHIPRKPGSNTELVDQGYRVTRGGSELQALGDKSQFPARPFLSLAGPAGGVTVAIQRLPFLWPGSLRGDADGRVTVGVFPAELGVPYTFVWQQHESRTAIFAFHRVTPADPGRVPYVLDFPVTGRAQSYAHYRDAQVFPYRLVTTEEVQAVLAGLGINHAIAPANLSPTATRYLYSHQTGGPNNFPRIETSLAAHWLRHGLGGHWVEGLDLALYKSEWQIRRSDDFVDAGAALAPTNNALPHTTGQFSDDEHRYREGIILAYYLTGDTRFKEAIFDEAEVLRGVVVWQHERSMYRTLVALAHVIEFTDDEELRDDFLIPRLEYITGNVPSGADVIDVCSDSSGFGWSGPGLPAGAILPEERRYYVFSGDLNNEKDDPCVSGTAPTACDPAKPLEAFQARGFITASFGPTGYFHAARVLDPADPAQLPMHLAARERLRDLAWWTREELFRPNPLAVLPNGNPNPHFGNPDDYRLVYSYGVSRQCPSAMDDIDFHPILMGMTEMYLDLLPVDEALALDFLDTGAQQLKAAKLHNHLDFLLFRLDCQHFFAHWLDVHGE